MHGGGDELVLPAHEGRGAKGAGDEVAVAAVLVAVHGQDDGAHDRTHGVGVDPGREALGVAEDGVDVGESGEHPQRRVETLDGHDRGVTAARWPRRCRCRRPPSFPRLRRRRRCRPRRPANQDAAGGRKHTNSAPPRRRGGGRGQVVEEWKFTT